jgi:hypothetical protein
MAIRVSRQTTEVLLPGAGNLRVSRQFVEVLGADKGPLRVSRHYVDVLVPYEPTSNGVSTLSFGQVADYRSSQSYEAENTLQLTQGVEYVGPKWVSAQNTISFDQFVYVPAIYELSAESVLSELGVALDVGGTRRLEVESVLTLNQFGDNIVKVRHEESTLNLIHEAIGEKVYVGRSQLNLTHEATSGALTKSAESTLNLTQEANYRPRPQFAESTLELTQSAWASMMSRSEEHTLDLTHEASVQKPIRVSAESPMITSELVYNEETYEFDLVYSGLGHSATVNPQLGADNLTHLSFSQIATAGHVKAAGTSVSGTSAITFTHSAVVNLTGDGTSTLALSQTAFGQAGLPIDNQLVLTQTATFTIDRTQTAASAIPISQAAAYTLILASTKCQYSPFVGSSTDPNAPTPPSLEIDGPMAGIQVPFQLVYPSTGAVTDAVSLSTPNLGNLDRLSFNRIQRETRGGTLIVYSDPNWPKIQTLVLSFSGLLNVEAQALLTFMDDYLGQEIGMIDWEHRYWRGVIISPDEPIVEDRFDSFTASFSFEGELDPAWNPQVVPPSLRYSATRTPQEDGYYVPNEPILPSVDITYYSAEADSTTKIGSPLYLTGAGHVDLAQANAAGTVQVVGLALEVVAAGFSCNYISEGSIERSNWSGISGTASLSPGATYFLDPSTAGRITTTAPTTAGQYVVRVGRAVNTTTLDIEIELPILL